jgi:hypothetical protein
VGKLGERKCEIGGEYRMTWGDSRGYMHAYLSSGPLFVSGVLEPSPLVYRVSIRNDIYKMQRFLALGDTTGERFCPLSPKHCLGGATGDAITQQCR